MATNSPTILVSNPMEALLSNYSTRVWTWPCHSARFWSTLRDWWSSEGTSCLLTCMTKFNLLNAVNSSARGVQQSIVHPSKKSHPLLYQYNFHLYFS